MQATLKHWPGDAVMIVAANFGKENRKNMESVVEVECRDCGEKLGADSFTIRNAEQLKSRKGRPIKFFCVPCSIQYDLHSMTEVHDHSDGETYADAFEKAGHPNVIRRPA